jgi:polyhydroxyalkanoate synthase subunit PhaC
MQDYFSFINQLVQGFVSLGRISAIRYQYNVRELVYQRDKIKLYHYQPKAKKINSTPLLVVFATVNRPEILDLFPERSFIGGLLENGMDVYLLDWGYPDLGDKTLSISDYVINYLRHCVEFIIHQNQLKKINLLGICQGGVLCLCYAALSSSIKNLVLISTPIDFHTRDNTIGKFLNTIDFETATQMMGNISGSWLTQFFISLRPFELVGKKYLRYVDNLNNEALTERFLRVEKWLYDAPDQAGAAFTEFAIDFYKKNKLIKGDIAIHGKKINLADVTIPILNVMARDDEIVPMSASRVLKKYVGSKAYSQRIFPSGHIGIYVSDKVGKRMSKAIAGWLKMHNR